jgi:hypothetical protein
LIILFFARHSRLTGLRFIAYYRSARAGLQENSRILGSGERTETVLRGSRQNNDDQNQLSIHAGARGSRVARRPALRSTAWS